MQSLASSNLNPPSKAERSTCREFVASTGSSYYRARYYDAIPGRFLTEDPIHFRAGGNFYRYVWNSPNNYADGFGLWGAGITGGATYYGGVGYGAGGTVSGGGIFFADPSNPLGFTSGGFLTEGGWVGPKVGNWGYPCDFVKGNYSAGFAGGFGAGFIVTNGNSIDDLAGPFTNTTLSLPFVSVDLAKSGSGVYTLSVTAGPGWGLGVAHYTTNTWTNPVSKESFSHPGTPTTCGCNTGP